MAGLVAELPAGSESECEPPPLTLNDSLPDTTDAPPVSVHPAAPPSKSPPGARVYWAKSSHFVNGRSIVWPSHGWVSEESRPAWAWGAAAVSDAASTTRQAISVLRPNRSGKLVVKRRPSLDLFIAAHQCAPHA